jgi:hypothetical protein
MSSAPVKDKQNGILPHVRLGSSTVLNDHTFNMQVQRFPFQMQPQLQQHL